MQDGDTVRAALIGCGGRGTGVGENWLQSAEGVELVAMADLFADRLAESRGYLASLNHAGFRVDDSRCFTGWDAHRRVMERADVDVVLLATPPGFRPLMVEAAVEAGKHVFMEKPVAVDPTGVRRILAAGERARERGLSVVAGTQYRHQDSFLETMRRVHDGAIGEIREARIFYNAGPLGNRGRAEGWSDMEYQIRNWWYFDWLSGDCIVEQHVHTIDVANWALRSHPVAATATGGRVQRTGEHSGNIYDHFAVDYEYPGGVHCVSMNRQWRGSSTHVAAYFIGTEGVAAPYSGEITGPNAWRYTGGRDISHAYVQEHSDLVTSIREGRGLNEAAQIAESTLTGILGREAAYTGRTMTWDEARESTQDYTPATFEFGPLPVRSAPVPGRS